MKEQLVTLYTAKLAKEKGFNETCEYGYFDIDNEIILDISDHNNSDNLDISAPTQSLLQKWLRRGGIIVLANTHKDHAADVNDEFEWYPIIQTKKLKIGYNNFDYGSYTKALEAGLIEGLKLIKL